MGRNPFTGGGGEVCPYCRTLLENEEGLSEHMRHCGSDVQVDSPVSVEVLVNLRDTFQPVVLGPGVGSSGDKFHKQSVKGTMVVSCRKEDDGNYTPMKVETAVVNSLGPCRVCWR